MKTHDVLLLIGGTHEVGFVARTLIHPGIDVHHGYTGNPATVLAERIFDVVIVGGTVGTRGPLVLCEAVRMHQQSPIVVLVGPDVSATALAQHRTRDLPNVTYLAFNDWNVPERALTIATHLRRRVLEVLALDEDPHTAQQWQERLRLQLQSEAEQAPARRPTTQPMSVIEGPPPRAPSELIARDLHMDADLDPEALKANDTAPPLLTRLTPDDLDFAERVVHRTRNTNFRVPLTSTALEAGADGVSTRLRDQVRSLEGQLARLAFVYRARKSKLDRHDEVVTELQRLRMELVAAKTAHADHVVQLQDQHTQGMQAQEQRFTDVLQRIEASFDAQRAHAAESLAEHQRQILERDERVQRLQAQLDAAQDLAEVRAEELRSVLASHEEQLQARMEAERTAAAATAEAHEAFAQEKAILESARAVLTEEVQGLMARLDHAGAEIARLRAIDEEQRALLTGLGEDLAQARAAHAREQNERHDEVARLRAGYEEQLATQRATQQEQLDGLRTQHARELHQADLALNQERGMLTEQLREEEARWRSERDAYTHNLATEEAQWREQMGQTELRFTAALEEHARAHAQRESAWQQEHDRFSQTIATLEEACREKDEQARAYGASLADLDARLDERAREVKALEKALYKDGSAEAIDTLGRRVAHELDLMRGEILHQEASALAGASLGASPSGLASQRAWRWFARTPERLIAAGALVGVLLVTLLLAAASIATQAPSGASSADTIEPASLVLDEAPWTVPMAATSIAPEVPAVDPSAEPPPALPSLVETGRTDEVAVEEILSN